MTDVADLEPFTGMMTHFNALDESGNHNAFWVDVNGQMYGEGEVPGGTAYPYATILSVSDANDDTFTEEMVEQYIQFSLFSGMSSKAEIKRMDTHLTALFKDKVFTVTGWTVVVMRRISGNGPINVPADTEAGTGRYWQFDSDYTIILNKN